MVHHQMKFFSSHQEKFEGKIATHILIYMLPPEWIFQPEPFQLAKISLPEYMDPGMNTNI